MKALCQIHSLILVLHSGWNIFVYMWNVNDLQGTKEEVQGMTSYISSNYGVQTMDQEAQHLATAI